MSAPEPFAFVESVNDIYGIHVADVHFFCNETTSAMSAASKINAAVVERERQAAARALREAADAVIDLLEYPCCEAEQERIVEILRDRADRAEKGET